MKNYLILLFFCFAAIACNDFEEEYEGYIIDSTNNTTNELVSVNYNACVVKYGHSIAFSKGNTDIADVKFEVGDKTYDAQKDGDFYCANIEVPYDEVIYVRTIATIEGKEETLRIEPIKKQRSDFNTVMVDDYAFVLTPGYVRFFVRYKSDVCELSSAKMRLAWFTFPMKKAKDNTLYCDVDINELGTVYSCIPEYTFTNEVVSNTETGNTTFDNRGYLLSSYDPSHDGETIDDCIYLAGTKWAKGVIATNSSNKQYIANNYYVGDQLWYSKRDYQSYYDFQGEYDDPVTNALGSEWATPSREQMNNLTYCCSIQKIYTKTSSGETRVGYIAFPAKGDIKVECIISGNVGYSNLLQLREKSVYFEGKYGNGLDCNYASSYVDNNIWSIYYYMDSDDTLSSIWNYASSYGYYYVLPIKK